MDHLRISDTEPSSVILSKKKAVSKVEKRSPKSKILFEKKIQIT